MRTSTFVQLSLSSCALAAPVAQAPAGFDLGALLGGLGGLGGAGAGGLPALPAGLDLGSLLGGLGGAGGAGGLPDFGALLSGLGGGAPDTSTPVIISGYTAVTQKGQAYHAAIIAIPGSGDATAAIKDVLLKAKDVEQALKDATPKIAAIPNVDLLASQNLSAPGDAVTSFFDKSSAALVAKNDVIAKAGQKAAVLAAAKSLKDATVAFTNAINGKLPDLSKQAAEGESKKSLDSLDKVIAAFT